jgi:hypothetical protein
LRRDTFVPWQLCRVSPWRPRNHPWIVAHAIRVRYLILLAQRGADLHPPIMFAVSEADAAVIRAAYERDGELSAAIELRRLFPGIVDNENARICARTIAGWTPLPAPTRSVTRLRAGKRR